MIVIRIRLRVTVRALEHAVVVWIGMAGRTHSIRSAVVHGEVGVIEDGIQPGGGRMAGRATGRESRRHVVRIGRSLVIDSVAAVTIRRQRRVVIVHVAAGAGHFGVRPGERE